MRKNAILVLIIFLTTTTLLISQNQIINEAAVANKQLAQDTSFVINDSEIVVPESLNESVEKLLSNWQISFSNSDNQCTQGSNIVYTDSVYMHRLYALPTEMELSYNPVVSNYIDMYAKRRRDLVSYMLSLGDHNP